MRFFLISISLLISVPNFLKAQTCCSGGSPITGNLGIQEIDPKGWYVQLSYDYNFLDASDLVVAFRYGDQIKAYPYDILDWHEIVNDSFDDLHVSVVYCPLTGTATIWNRTIDGKTTTFGVSGLLYNTNIIPYDRETDSNWSQLFDRSINGTNIRKRIKNYMPLETSWNTFKLLYPNADVMNTSTGFNRNYGSYPYGDYRSSTRLIFPVMITGFIQKKECMQ